MKDSILEEALEITNGSRNSDYGDLIEGFRKMAVISTELLNKEITPLDVCIILKVLKQVRHSNKSKRDNLTDEAGYTRLQSILEGYETNIGDK